MRLRTENPTPRASGALTVIVLSLVLTLSCATASWALGGWSKVPHDPAVLGSTGHVLMMGVASSSPGLVAVGTDSGTGGAAIWLSADGTTWSRVPNQPDFGLGLMLDVTEGPTDMVAVGYVDTPMGDDAAVWIGSGLTWSRVPHDPAVFGGTGDQLMQAVCEGGPGVVAVGFDDDMSNSTDAAVWTSPDGTTWTRVPHDETALGANGNLVMYDVVAGGPGLVAVGYDDSGGDLDAAVWVSVDGLTWTRVPHSEAIFGGPSDQTLNAVAVGDAGLLVAVGSDGRFADGAAAVWTSTDGMAWTRVTHNENIFGGSGFQSMADVTHGGPGFVAVGSVFNLTSWVAAVWTSEDGTAWEREHHDPTVFGRSNSEEMRAVTVDDTGLVVGVGRDVHWGLLVAAVWTNDSWLYPSLFAPAPDTHPNVPEYRPWLENPFFLLAAIAFSVLILGVLGWRLAAHRKAKP